MQLGGLFELSALYNMIENGGIKGATIHLLSQSIDLIWGKSSSLLGVLCVQLCSRNR